MFEQQQDKDKLSEEEIRSQNQPEWIELVKEILKEKGNNK